MRSPSRRTFLRGAAALAACTPLSRLARGLDSTSAPSRVLAYVGTYTKSVDGAAGRGKGIYLFEADLESGKLSLLKLAAETANPSWLALHPSGKYLYSVNEVSDFNGDSGAVSAFAVNRSNGDLHALNTVSSHGAGPTHLSLDASGRYVFVANYFGGSIAVLPVQADGRLGEAVDVHADHGFLGSIHATDPPPGSFAISGHDAPHAHMIHADSDNRFVLQTDLGQDRVYVYKLHLDTGKLTPAATPFVTLPSGDGPRHFVFHPNGRWMYSIQEEASTLVYYHYNPSAGALVAQQTVSALPPGFTGTNFCSEVVVTRDGRFLYAANRLHNSIAVFAIGSDGRLSRIGEAMTEGDYPNHIAIAPGGAFSTSATSAATRSRHSE